MAGMLPGVECARRRRLHQGGDSPSAAVHSWTRRSSFCLYTSNYDSHHSSISAAPKQRSIVNQACVDEKLGGAAREAKERLDKRLRTLNKSDTTRHKSCSMKVVEGKSMEAGEFQREGVRSGKKGVSKSFNWAKLRWKGREQDECSICLERLRSSETLVHLPCAHRFHSRCLLPWLEKNAHCPCCRMELHVEFS